MLKGFSSSRKRATAVFNLPGHGLSVVQELPGCECPVMREAIKQASKVFFKIYNAKSVAGECPKEPHIPDPSGGCTPDCPACLQNCEDQR